MPNASRLRRIFFQFWNAFTIIPPATAQPSAARLWRVLNCWVEHGTRLKAFHVRETSLVYFTIQPSNILILQVWMVLPCAPGRLHTFNHVRPWISVNTLISTAVVFVQKMHTHTYIYIYKYVCMYLESGLPCGCIFMYVRIIQYLYVFINLYGIIVYLACVGWFGSLLEFDPSCFAVAATPGAQHLPDAACWWLLCCHLVPSEGPSYGNLQRT